MPRLHHLKMITCFTFYAIIACNQSKAETPGIYLQIAGSHPFTGGVCCHSPVGPIPGSISGSDSDDQGGTTSITAKVEVSGGSISSTTRAGQLVPDRYSPNDGTVATVIFGDSSGSFNMNYVAATSASGQYGGTEVAINNGVVLPINSTGATSGTLQFSQLPQIQASTSGANGDGGSASIVWSFNGALPGSTKTSPLPTHEGFKFIGRPPSDPDPDPTPGPAGTVPEPGQEASMVAGVNLVAPVVDAYGRSSSIFAGATGSAASASLERPPASGASNELTPAPVFYFQSIGDTNFTSFTIPDALADGETAYTIEFGGIKQNVHTGDMIDFTGAPPNGIYRFQVFGFNDGLQVNSDGSAPFVWGATYSENGIAIVNVADVVPGDYNNNGVVDVADYVVWRHSLGTSVSPFTNGDGNGDGVVDQSDYDTWRKDFGNTLNASSTLALANQVPVPEPSSGVAGCLAIAILAAKHRMF